MSGYFIAAEDSKPCITEHPGKPQVFAMTSSKKHSGESKEILSIRRSLTVPPTPASYKNSGSYSRNQV
jgi:hypothetical protein